MPLTADQRHALLLADRSRDAGQITVVIEHALAANPDADLFDVELAFRDAACAAYVIAGPSKAFHVVTGGLSAMLAVLGAAGRSPLENRAVLAGKPGAPRRPRPIACATAAPAPDMSRYGFRGTTAQQCPMGSVSKERLFSATVEAAEQRAREARKAADLAALLKQCFWRANE